MNPGDRVEIWDHKGNKVIHVGELCYISGDWAGIRIDGERVTHEWPLYRVDIEGSSEEWL